MQRDGRVSHGRYAANLLPEIERPITDSRLHAAAKTAVGPADRKVVRMLQRGSLWTAYPFQDSKIQSQLRLRERGQHMAIFGCCNPKLWSPGRCSC